MEEYAVFITDENGNTRTVFKVAASREAAIAAVRRETGGTGGERYEARSAEGLTPDSIYQQFGGRGRSSSVIPPIPVPEGLPGGNTPVVGNDGRNAFSPTRTPEVAAYTSGVIDTIPEDLGRRTTRDEAINALVRGEGTQVDDFTPAVGQVIRERFGTSDSLLSSLFNQRTDSFEDAFIGRGNVDASRASTPIDFVRQTGLGGLGETAINNVRGYLNSPDNFDFGNALENVIIAAGTVSGSHRRSVINRQREIQQSFINAGLEGLDNQAAFRRALEERTPGILRLVGG